MILDAAVAMPEPSGSFDSIGPLDSLQDAIDDAAPGSTIYLDPGIYRVHGLTISKNIYIVANQSAGADRSNTILDAEVKDRVFNVTGPSSVVIDNLTLRNGYVNGDGGAVYAPDSPLLFIMFSDFENCTALHGGGGAVYSNARITFILSSTFSQCMAIGSSFYTQSYSGGAVYASGGTLGILSSTFTDCSAPLTFGGAIESHSRLVVAESSFLRCSAVDGGGVDIYTDAEILLSNFTDCSATGSPSINYPGFGGGIWSIGADEVILDSLVFSGCSAQGNGGAFFNQGPINTITFFNSSFTCCSATRGGGVYLTRSITTIESSTFTGCSAGSGGAVSLDGGTGVLHFNRLYQNTASGTGPAINATGDVDATRNWWGDNLDPSPKVFGPVTTDPWLVLGITSTPSSINAAQSPAIRANLISDSAGTNTAGGGIFVPANITSSFAVVTGNGSVSPPAAGTANGIAQTRFQPTGPGTANISATVDDQTVYLGLTVSPAPASTPVATLDTRTSDSDPQPTVNPTAGIPAASVPLMTVTVNIGGDSKAWQAVVTGTKLSELIVTGTVLSGSGSNVTAPPGTVFEYISLVPARYDSITKAVINFTVPQSWLDENHIAPGSIVLYHQTANGWEALLTTVLYTKDGTVYFSAVSPGFSLFAIAGTPTVLTPPGIVSTPEILSTPVQEQAPAAVAKVLVTTQTIAPPAATPQPSAPLSLVNIVLVIAVIGVLAGGGFMVRRWWIQRQNPALFREYD
jgi:PGF-pre-PGF domain-containing protein